ncbi:hypothetical protein [Micromonospora purpureochromogenes]|uniref:Uncharacterized protein n=1 Tax=Micromonospora purpureochromogenes TaxID=47872 RepID=A0ABX2RTJ1_9ACTN|nr:hypothetical protein [Micromonospora purpureochromogenes]NYF59365.1 hypothetical protein [Micromonospora purpureochromogenes]
MTDPTAPMPAGEPADPSQPPFPPTADPTSTTPPGGMLLGAPVSATPGQRSHVRAWAVGGIALVIALCCGGAVVGAALDDEKQPAASASSSPSTAIPTTASAAPTTVAPTVAAPTTTAPTPTKTTPPSKPKPPSYKALTERQWKLIAKNPDAYMGKTYVVYGRVTQFDAATGTDSFRADVAHRRMADEYEYETNTILNGSESDLDNLVEDDIFRANVTVLGSFSYDTQIGGETTVPMLMVNSIKVL